MMKLILASAWLSAASMSIEGSSSAAGSPAADGAQGPAGATAHGGATTASMARNEQSAPCDAPLEPWRVGLIGLAFDAASAIPVSPHGRDRSRAQESVVAACLALDQPTAAASMIDGMDDWRRGSAGADLAFHLARRGMADVAERWLSFAATAAESADGWRRDRIRVKIARTYVLLGDHERAAPFGSNVIESEIGKVDAAGAMSAAAEEFDERLARIDAHLATGHFDVMRNALEACTQLYDRFYTDPSRRSQAEARVRTALPKMPLRVRLELLERLAGICLEHGDAAASRALVEEAEGLLGEHQWTPDFEIPVRARFAALRFRGGEADRARAVAAAALAHFDSARRQIETIDRAATLRPLAEAHKAMGDAGAAHELYRRAAEEGAANPNARPRALDLAATCISMAVTGVEPDEPLWSRLRELRGGLSDPW